jgi:hypothetical protein
MFLTFSTCRKVGVVLLALSGIAAVEALIVIFSRSQLAGVPGESAGMVALYESHL